MFYFKKDKDSYFIFSDNSKGKYGPFSGVYIKNKPEGKINESTIDLKKYPSYKYGFGIGKKYLFVVSGKGIKKLIDLKND